MCADQLMFRPAPASRYRFQLYQYPLLGVEILPQKAVVQAPDAVDNNSTIRGPVGCPPGKRFPMHQSELRTNPDGHCGWRRRLCCARHRATRLPPRRRMKIKTILTDNGCQFTDRFTSATRSPSGQHVFDLTCRSIGSNTACAHRDTRKPTVWSGASTAASATSSIKHDSCLQPKWMTR